MNPVKSKLISKDFDKVEIKAATIIDAENVKKIGETIKNKS